MPANKWNDDWFSAIRYYREYASAIPPYVVLDKTQLVNRIHGHLS